MAKKVDSSSHLQKESDSENEKRSRISQSDVPSATLEKALSVPRAIFDNYGSKPTKPLQVAKALDLSPSSSGFRMLCGAAIAYGLTSGGYNAQEITVEPLSKRILRPTTEGDDKIAKIEALLKPKVVGDFFRKYEGNPIPREDIAMNVLEEMGVPKDKTEDILELILSQGEKLGIIMMLKSRKYVDLANQNKTGISFQGEEELNGSNHEDNVTPLFEPEKNYNKQTTNDSTITALSPEKRSSKVFISHGKNKKIVDQIKEILKFGQFETVVSVEKESTAIPVPEKVFSDMRNCTAAIIHIEGEEELLDKEGNRQYKINENVLIEIGAAIALYEKRFILLCEKSLKMPSNLQGLYRCDYEGTELNYEATMKLLKAFNEFR